MKKEIDISHINTIRRLISGFIALSVAFVPLLAGTAGFVANAETAGLTVTGDADYTQDTSTGNITISQNGNYTITGDGNMTTSSVTVTGCMANITISDVDITQIGDYAFKLFNNATVNLTLVGHNTLACSTYNGADNRDISYAGLSVNEGNTVTIMGSGELTAQGSGSGYDYFSGAGIGGDSGYNCGTVNITDGTVNATGGFGGAGIGGGYTGQGVSSGSNGGTINISGGTVIANAQFGAGIGGGWAGQSGGGGCAINISGGAVTANGGNGAGIGGGEQGAGGTVSISGGTVIATGGTYHTDVTGGAGIGVGLDGAAGSVSISGGSVNATGGKLSPGIGSSISCSTTGAVTISGGTVVANGGGGYNGGGGGAGIGGGEGVPGGTVIISGGAVTATGGGGSDYNGGHNGGGAGIGGGSQAPGGTVSISGVGTTVTATGMDNGYDIGSGYSSVYIYPPLSCGSLKVGDASVNTAPLPTVTLASAGTHADSVYKNCIITGSAAVSAGIKGTYDANGCIIYNVVFDKNGGDTDASPASVIVEKGSTAALPINPTRTGYHCTGWRTQEISGNVFDSSTPVTGDMTVYAQWSLNTYTIAYSLNGGTNSSDNTATSYTYDDPAIPLHSPTRSGYTFGGWYTDSGFTGAAVNAIDDTPAGRYSDGDTITFYAKWVPNTCSISYNLNGGTNNPGNTAASYTSGSSAIQLGSPTRTGFTFGGWYTDSGFTGSAVNAVNDTLASQYSDGDTIRLYAQWSPNTYAIAYNLNGGTNSSDNTANSYTYDEPAITLHSPTRSGYTFGGWYTDSGFTGTAVNAIDDTPAGRYSDGDTITFYAKWVPNIYSTSFILNGGTNNSKNTATSYTYGSSAMQLGSPTRNGYTFGGWYTNSGFTGSAVNVINDTLASRYGNGDTITFYAQWTPSSIAPPTPTPPAPTDVSIVGAYTENSDGTTSTTALIPASDTNTSTARSVLADLGLMSVMAPSSVLNAALGGDGTASLQLSQGTLTSASAQQIQATARSESITPVFLFHIDLTSVSAGGTRTPVHQLNGFVTVVVRLTAAQLAQITSASNAHLVYFDPTSGTFTDMNATFNLTAKTATFTTTHFSTFLLTVTDKTPPTVTGVENNGLYNTNKTVTFNKGTAMLDGTAFTSGSTVSAERKHTLIVTDAAGNVETVVFVIDKTAPVVTGVSDGGIYNADKTVAFNEGAATLDGAVFTSGGSVSTEGKHILVVTDAAGNMTMIDFVMDKALPVITLKSGITPVKNGVISPYNVTVNISDLFSVTKSITLNGKSIHWPSNSVFTKDGKYAVLVKDQYGHTSKSTFTIDKTIPKITVKRVKGGVIITITEVNLSAKMVTLNGKKVAWPSGNKFTQKGIYTIVVTDYAGHKSNYRFKI